MAKSVFRPTEVKKSDEKVILNLSRSFANPEPEEIIDDIPEYTGPTADELRREAEAFKAQWAIDKQQMLEDAKEEASNIVKEAEQAAFDEVKRQTDRAQVLKQQAEDEAAEIIHEAEKKSLDLIQEGEQKRKKLLDEAYNEGFSQGREEGFDDGKGEVNRLIERLHVILGKILDKRQEILDETEYQIIELVLLISRKVVKIISESQRSVIIANVVQALKKVKGRGDVTIRVNMADAKLTSEHIKEFTEAVESVKNITIAEDSTVEKGGCIVETDFGTIDARISSQLTELEQKILEISPIKTVIRNPSGATSAGEI
ncbi:MAG: flagellar assembly protein FliH [Treponema sp.]|nr:flagellar assembly protein FliH [Treponema sp.]